MIVELLMIGNELLIGKTQDTNSNYLAKRITKYGHHLRRITTIGDDLDEISNGLKDIINHQPDLVIISGGLGPTFDDMTLQGVGLALNREIKLNQDAYNSIKKAYDQAYKRGILKLEGMTKERENMSRCRYWLTAGFFMLFSAIFLISGAPAGHADRGRRVCSQKAC